MGKIEEKYKELLEKESDINLHFPLIRKTIQKNDIVVELGTRNIVSAWALLANNPKILFSIDVMRPPAENLKEIEDAAKEAGTNFMFLQGDSTEAILNAPCDVLFIDTLHLYSHLVKELFRHSESVKRNIIFHDSKIPEVRSCIQDFLFNPRWFFKEESLELTGLLIVERKL